MPPAASCTVSARVSHAWAPQVGMSVSSTSPHPVASPKQQGEARCSHLTPRRPSVASVAVPPCLPLGIECSVLPAVDHGRDAAESSLSEAWPPPGIGAVMETACPLSQRAGTLLLTC